MQVGQGQSRKKMVTSVSWTQRNIFKITDIEEHFQQVYLKSINPHDKLCCLRFLRGDQVKFLNHIWQYWLNLSLLASAYFTVKNATSWMLLIKEYQHRFAQDARNIRHFF